MRIALLPLALLITLGAAPAHAGVSIHLNIGLPPAPPLVEVQPGLQVVEGFPEEVFFSAGYYWCRRPEGWYRARSPRDRFDRIDARWVPGPLMQERAGHYRDWHRGEGRWEGGQDHRGGGRRRWDDR